MSAPQQANRRSALRFCALVLGMFGFGFALGPLYTVMCQLTGWNGKWNPMVANAAAPVQVDTSRSVKVEFMTSLSAAPGWKFRAGQSSIMVHPGQLYTVDFYAQNPEEHAVIAQAVPSVAPWEASKHLKKTECFCFTRQEFKAGEEKHMPVRFMLDPELPASVDTVTLSYSFYDVTAAAVKAGVAQPQS